MLFPNRGQKPVAVALAVLCVVLVGVSMCLAACMQSSASNQVAQEASNASAEVKALARPQIMATAMGDSAASVQPNVAEYTVKKDLSNVTNINDVYMSDEAKQILAQYGFVVEEDRGGQEFFDVYETNRYAKLPNFVTVDSLMHTYHLYFQHLQKSTEKDHLAAAVLGMSQQLLQESQRQLDSLKGSELEQAALRNVAFFAVGAALQDPSTQIPAEVADTVAAELGAIEAASGIQKSAITQDDEDYSQYKPRGYYAGDPTLEAYFRTMMWYGRMNFRQSDEDLDRSAMLMTLALTGDAYKRWEAVYTVTSFFAGASDDCGYFEYKPLIDASYGADVAADALVGNEEAWQRYHALTATMPAPQINSVPQGTDSNPDASPAEDQKGYRLMGQRFTLDEMIFAQLLYPNVGKNASGQTRTMPDALDVPAVLGSTTARAITQDRGYDSFDKYATNLETLRAELSDEDDPRWSASLYAQWLYTINPLLATKGEGYPTFMQTEQWARKNLQGYLGSYTELKHDTVLYGKQVLAEGGGGPLEDVDDRGYVEPEPEVFARLANLTSATSTGLEGYGLLDSDDKQYLALLQELANRLQSIAYKELCNEAILDDEYELIRTYGEQLEHFWQEVYKDEADDQYFTSMEFPAALVVDVATDASTGNVLQLGTGRCSKITVVVPVDGELRIASGSTFSFYQFEQPLSERLTDAEWRQMLGMTPGSDGRLQKSESMSLEDWTGDFTVSNT